MNIRPTYNRTILAVAIVMIVVLPFLAYLQYSWLGQLGEEELAKMKNNLRTSAFDCSVDFRQNLVTALNALGGPLEGSDRFIRSMLSQRINTWKLQSQFPYLVFDSIEVGSRPDGIPALPLMLDTSEAMFLLRDLSAIAFPIRKRPQHVALVFLNTRYVTSSLIPAVLQRHFSVEQLDEYEFALVNQSGKILYQSRNAMDAGTLDSADVSVPFLEFPLGLHPFFAPVQSPRESFPLPHIGENEPSRRLSRDLRDSRPLAFDAQGKLPLLQQGRARDMSMLELRIKHRKGSLEMVVAKNRERNLLLSFGILLLLGSSIVILSIAANRAQRLARQQTEFVAAISHELRTPLATLQSAGENIADGLVREKDRLQKYGDLIKEEVIRLSDMVEKALAYSKIQSGKNTIEYRPLVVQDLVDDAIREVRKQYLKQRLTIETSYDNDLPRIMGDPMELKSAIENLIANALKYSKQNKIVKIAATKASTKNHSYVRLAISDVGTGIPFDELPRIFGPFYRGRNATEGQVKGSGLGLSIAKHIVESHGGSIFVESSPGKGSTFTIQLPVAVQ
jgi:signal transduction histidine kinase